MNISSLLNSFDISTSPIRLGMIGLSDGNGHPYSWSAIVNGYDLNYLKDCPFPSIPEYISKSNINKRLVDNISITHVWTQDPKLSRHIADSCLIPNVVDNFTDMVGKVDAILLARDDAENHLYFSMPFLLSGIPIYIDKPLSYSYSKALLLLSHQQFENQIFTCSALRYAREFIPSNEFLAESGSIQYVSCTAPKNWAKYSIHIIEPLLKLLYYAFPFHVTLVHKSKYLTSLHLSTDCGITASITTIDATHVPFKIDLYAENSMISMQFVDPYSAFRSALLEFLNIVMGKKPDISREFTLACIKLIEAGLL